MAPEKENAYIENHLPKDDESKIDWKKIEKESDDIAKMYHEEWEKRIKIGEEISNSAIFDNDKVNHPNHYTRGEIECIDAIRASMTPEEFRAYCKGNVMKYVWCYVDKGGVEDLEKARVYLNWMIESAKTKTIKKTEWKKVDG